MPKKRIGLVALSSGVAVVIGAVALSGGSLWTPELASDTSDPSTTSSPARAQPLLPCGETDAELTHYPDRGLTIPDLPLPRSETHPRLDFTPADVPLLRARANGTGPDPHGLYARNWRQILDDTRDAPDGSSADDVTSRVAKANGFAFVVTGEARYRDAALRAMAKAFRTFDSDDAYIAAQLTNYTQAYDYVAGSVQVGDPRNLAARESIKRGARWLVDWMNGEEPKGSNPRPHNHRSKAALAVGLWSLAFSADADAGEWLPLAVDQVNSVYRYMFTRDGIYLDGYAYYWAYQLFQVVPFLYAARNATGVDAFPAMRPAFEWMVRDSSPQGWLMNIEDSWVKPAWTAVVARPYLGAPTRLSASGGGLGNILQWRFFHQDWAAPRYPESWTGASNQAYTWPDEIIHVDQSIAEVAPDADGFDFYDQGGNTTVMRSDWKYGDPATRWLMFYGAPQSNNHDHCDVMQVLLNAENTVLLTDSGYGPERFSRRSAWFPADRHSVVTMDGAGVRDVFANPVNLNGAAADYAEKLAYYDQTEAGTPGTMSWRRGVLFAGHDYAVIADTTHAPTAQDWDSYLHGRGSYGRSGAASVWTTPDNVFGERAKLYALTLPATADISHEAGQSNLFGAEDAVPDTEPNVYLRSRQRGTDAQYLTVALPRGARAGTPAFTDLSTGDVLAATVAYDGHLDTVLKQIGTAARSAGRLTTDARLGWARESADHHLAAWQLTDGTALDHGGVTYLRASARVSATADLTAGHPVIDIVGPGEECYSFSVRGDYATATLDGETILGTRDGDLTTFQITGGGRLLPGAGTTVDPTPHTG